VLADDDRFLDQHLPSLSTLSNIHTRQQHQLSRQLGRGIRNGWLEIRI
jgi:hypothetical protein